MSQTYNYSGKLTIEEKIFHSYSEYPSKYLGCVNFFSVEQNFEKNEIILKLVNIRMVSLSTFNLQMRNFISWSTIREEKRKDELMHKKIICTIMFLLVKKAEQGKALKLLA